jgi:hypothetical protein
MYAITSAASTGHLYNYKTEMKGFIIMMITALLPEIGIVHCSLFAV